ncbi:Hypothetical protein GLP15_3445 [Giardia lamblia P15]|uniref:Phosphatidylinositol-4-phosphate 5-kinase n=1 Tax=Giardia intestinalis (strain P15) TaxID=658858 RepID=E1F0B6_GIAIA|nr:Hypothetical protein GLP15_3445 [Giardia lamblia P15]
MDGLGCFELSPEMVYHGFFKDSVPHGPFGLVTMSQGLTYAGKFVNGNLTGQSIILFSDGSTFRGQFSENNAYGYGAIRVVSAGMDFAGSFIGSVPNGFGAIGTGNWRRYIGSIGSAEKGACSVYIGDFCDGEPDGIGMSIVTGADDLTGARRYNRFFGSFYGGVRSGSGVLYTGNNDMLIGTFINDKKSGLFMHIEGTSKQCEFRLYENDVCLNSHMLRGVYFKQPWILMNIYLDLQTMCPELVDICAAFEDFLSEVDYCLSSGLDSIFNGRNNYKKSKKYPIIDVILAQSTRQSVPCSTRLITDCRVSYPWITDALARHVRYCTDTWTTVHYNAYCDHDVARNKPQDCLGPSNKIRSSTPTPRVVKNNMALSGATSRASERTNSSLVSSKLSVQQSVFMDKVDNLKSSLLSCYDILRFIFCIYRAQEVLLLNEHTKMFSDQKTVFSIDIMTEALENEDSDSRYPMPSENYSWKIGGCTIFNPQHCKGLLNSVPDPYKDSTSPFLLGHAVNEMFNSTDEDHNSTESNEKREVSNSEEDAECTSESKQVKKKDEQESAKVAPARCFGVDGNYRAGALLSDIVDIDMSRAAKTVAGTSSYDNELVLAILKIVETNETISLFTLERMLLELFCSNRVLATYFLPNYKEIRRIVRTICKPSDEYLMARTLGIDTEKYISKKHDVDFEGFVEVMIALATLLGPQILSSVKADVLTSPISLFNVLNTGSKTASNTFAKGNESATPLDDLLKYIIVPFGNMLLKQLTTVTQNSEKAQSILEPLFSFMQKEDKTARECLKTVLSKLGNHDGMMTTGGLDVGMTDSARIDTLSLTTKGSSMNLPKSVSSLSQSRLQHNPDTNIKRMVTPIAKLRDPSRSLNLFESALLGSLALVNHLVDLFTIEPQVLAQIYDAPFYAINSKLWSTVISSPFIIYQYNRLFSTLELDNTSFYKYNTNISLLDVFKHINEVFKTIFVRKLKHTMTDNTENDEDDRLFSERSSITEDADHDAQMLADALEEVVDGEIADENKVENKVLVERAAQCLLTQFSNYNIYTSSLSDTENNGREIRFAVQSITDAVKDNLDEASASFKEQPYIISYCGTDDQIYEIVSQLMEYDTTPLMYLVTVVSHCYCSDACFERATKKSSKDGCSDGSFGLPSTAESSALTNSMLLATETLRDEIYEIVTGAFFADETMRCLIECIQGAHTLLRRSKEEASE